MSEWIAIAGEAAFHRLVLTARHPVVVAFESGNCEHCRHHRLLLSLAWRQLGWQLTTALLDVRAVPELAARFRITSYPTMAVFSSGTLVEQHSRGRDAASLTRRLADLVMTASEAVDSSCPVTTRSPAPSAVTVGDRPLLETIDDCECRCCA